MKIADAKTVYYGNRRALVDQLRNLTEQKKAAEEKYAVTGDKAFSDQAASLELSLEATNEAFQKNQKVIDAVMDEWCAISNAESSKQAGEAMAESAAEMGKILTVFRRISHGDIVPYSDEKKLMEYDGKMYQVAKTMQMVAQQAEKERKKYKSLWEDEDNESPEKADPIETADNAEYSGELPDIEIPSADVTADISMEA